ncbi:MAG: hypothetical protein JHD02_04360 [Thermoleophilaceae bacterium]|nr:hypothetical protein [Thermoleophilaceae bacterium]
MQILRLAKLGGYWDVALIFLITSGMVVCAAFDTHGLPRDLLAVSFVLYCPGAALLMRAQLHRGTEGFTYAVGLSIAVGILGASIIYYAEIADALRLLHLEAVVVGLLLAWELVARLRSAEAPGAGAETETAR